MQTNLMKIGSASIMALVLAAVSPVQANENKVSGADANNGKAIFENGKGDVPACNACHGPAGLGDDNMGTPRLAGQVYHFVVKQLEDFATDRRTDTTMGVMNNNAKGLSAQDRRDVAAYVSTLNVVTSGKQLQEPSGGSDLAALSASGVAVGQSHLGKAIVNYGDAHRGIPACLSCHGYNGRGAGPVYPKIGEQKYVYLTNQLKKWRDGSRSNDPMGQMQAVAKKLTDEDINNVAAYLTKAPPASLGNSRVPSEHLP